MSKSAFETWFIAQYGKPPRGWFSARARLEQARNAMERAETFYDRVADYETRRDAALTAWQASERG